MPLPTPGAGEGKTDWLERCMQNETMQSEYPDRDQRYAVCNRMWDEKAEAVIESKHADNILKAARQEDGTYRIVATTADVDRDEEIVVPTGVENLDEYLSLNPIVLVNHNWFGMPVGKAVGGEVYQDRIELSVQFAETELGREVRYLYDEGFLNSFSIGFGVKDYEDKAVEGKTVRHYTKWELYEVSAVTVPANRYANILRQVEERGKELSIVKSLFQRHSAAAEATPAPTGEKADQVRRNLAGLATNYERRGLWIKSPF
jgi:HK97 family phage prohead protease